MGRRAPHGLGRGGAPCEKGAEERGANSIC
jgi:hypothetical protein